MQVKTKNTIKKFIAFFYIYAFLGWVVDVSVCLVSDGVLTNRGFLFEPICPMYGYAALVLILIADGIKQKGFVGLLKKTVLATIWCSVLEYLTAWILDIFFHKMWWDYSQEPFNIQGRICLAASLFWGVLSVLFMTVLHPLVVRVLRKISSKVNPKVINVILYVAVGITVADTIVSIAKNIIL